MRTTDEGRTFSSLWSHYGTIARYQADGSTASRRGNSPAVFLLCSRMAANASARGQRAAILPRTVIVQLPDGRVASFAVYNSEEMRDRHTTAISKAQEIPEYRRVLPTASENIPSQIITSSSR